MIQIVRGIGSNGNFKTFCDSSKGPSEYGRSVDRRNDRGANSTSVFRFWRTRGEPTAEIEIVSGCCSGVARGQKTPLHGKENVEGSVLSTLSTSGLRSLWFSFSFDSFSLILVGRGLGEGFSLPFDFLLRYV